MKSYLTKKQKRELLDELDLECDRESSDRIKVILLLDQGKSAVDIARFLFLNETTVRHYKTRYDRGGLEELIIDDYADRSL